MRFATRIGIVTVVAFLALLEIDAAPATANGAEPVILLANPAGGAGWSVGSGHVVTWTAGGLPGNATVKLAYSTDAGQSWNVIGDAKAAAGKYLWKIPAAITKSARLRVSVNGPGKPISSEAKFTISPSQEVKDYTWTNVTNTAAYAPRDGAGALVFKNKMWLLGGWNPGDKKHFPRICNNEVWNSTDGAAWTLVKPNTFLNKNFDPSADWEGRHTAGYVVYQEKMWIIGGDVNQGHYQFDVWNSADGKNWKFVNQGRPVPWGPRALQYTLVHRDKIWILGGQTMPAFAPSKEKFHRDIWTTTDGVNWQEITPKKPWWSPRGMIGRGVVFKGRIWFLGGGTYDTPTTPSRNYYNDVWSSADGVNWKQHVAAAPWAPRQYHDVTVFDGRMWVTQGYSKANRNDVWYSADGTNWYEVPGTPWRPRHASSLYSYDNALWMVAGNNMQKDVWKLQRRGR